MNREHERRLSKLEARSQGTRRHVYRFRDKGEVEGIKAKAERLGMPIVIVPHKCESGAEWLERHKPAA